MSHRTTPVGRVVSGTERVSYELPSDATEGADRTPHLRQLSLNTSAPAVHLEPPKESDEDYAKWLERFPPALRHFAQIEQRFKGRRLAMFLDYDGTLTPIVQNPDCAFMSEEMRKTVGEIAELYPTAVISGRGLDKVRQFVGLDKVYYAGSHGLDICTPCRDPSSDKQHCTALQPAAELRPLIQELFDRLQDAVKHIRGAHVENNTFCLSVHFRNCSEESWDKIKVIVEKTVAPHDSVLKMARGRKVLDIRPRIDWGKGKAVEHFLRAWSCEHEDVVPLYLGDDRTDEDAFRYLRKRKGGGIGILVSSKAKPTVAHYSLEDPSEVLQFLRKLLSWGKAQTDHRTRF